MDGSETSQQPEQKNLYLCRIKNDPITASRKDLVKIVEQSDEVEALEFAQELKDAGMYAEASEDEIERFMEIV